MMPSTTTVKSGSDSSGRTRRAVAKVKYFEVDEEEDDEDEASVYNISDDSD